MKRGPKPKGKVVTEWSPQFAYAIGLFTADGCLLSDGRHLDFTSKDLDQVETFRSCLKINTMIGVKHSGAGNPYHRLQFSDVLFHRFLISIGLTPSKSKTITSVKVPDKYFRDFLRGYFDGDGTSSSYYDSLFPNSFRFYVSFMSASRPFLYWLRSEIGKRVNVQGHFSSYSKSEYIQLRYAKREGIALCGYMYSKAATVPLLKRKYLKIQETMRIIESCRDGEIGKHAAFRTQSSQGVGSSSLPRGTQ